MKPVFGVGERQPHNGGQHRRDRWCRPVPPGLGSFCCRSLTKSYLSNFSQNFSEQPCLRSWGTLPQTESTTCTVPSAPGRLRSFLSAGWLENRACAGPKGLPPSPIKLITCFITESLCHIKNQLSEESPSVPLSFPGKPVSECPSGQLRALTVSKAPPTAPVTAFPADTDLSDAYTEHGQSSSVEKESHFNQGGDSFPQGIP